MGVLAYQICWLAKLVVYCFHLVVLVKYSLFCDLGVIAGMRHKVVLHIHSKNIRMYCSSEHITHQHGLPPNYMKK